MLTQKIIFFFWKVESNLQLQVRYLMKVRSFSDLALEMREIHYYIFL